MTEKRQDPIQADRIYFLDNLRTFMIFLVVLYHSGLVYESSGISAAWWIVDDPSTNDLSGILNLMIDIIVMPTIFFISGYFTPLSLTDKSGWAFITSKFKRLLIPWILAVLTLIPLYKIIFLYSRNLPQESWTTYFHWTNGIWSQNWLWFLPVLFLFNILYLFMSRANLKISGITFKKAIGVIFIIGFIYSFCMSLFELWGWTKTILIDFQNERLLIYFLIFLLGSLCFRLKIFESQVTSKKWYIVTCCTVWIPMNLYIIVLINFFVRPGVYLFSLEIDRTLLWLGFHLSLLLMLYLLVATFRYFLNRRAKMMKALNENSYGVYIVHVIVVGSIALILQNTEIPSLFKYFATALSAWIISNLIVHLYRTMIRSRL